jgi:hypothetical protein
MVSSEELEVLLQSLGGCNKYWLGQRQEHYHRRARLRWTSRVHNHLRLVLVAEVGGRKPGIPGHQASSTLGTSQVGMV